MDKEWKGPLKKLDPFRWEIPQDYKKGMRGPGLIYSDEEMLKQIVKDHAPEQVANVAHLPGLVGPSMAMPDIHWGYGFPIGGVAAFDAEEGVVSPGGVGFDINCGVRLIRTNLSREDLVPHLRELVEVLFVNVPSGVGSKARVRMNSQEFNDVLKEGARWAVEHGFGWDGDLDHIEHGGELPEARPELVSERAHERGRVQVGSLGAGNHFCEVQTAAEILKPEEAKTFGITRTDQVCVMIHTGSRGCGHQICSDFLESMERAQKKYDIDLPDRQLACAPAKSREAEDYFGAMWAGQNFAWANRQMITHWVRQSFEKVFGNTPESMEMEIVYDVAHNVAKKEFHEVEGRRRELIVHRKGATRAFPRGNPDIPSDYRDAGQPVFIPGDMGTESYLLVGTARAMKETWGSTCHGAGRKLSRAAATRAYRGQDVIRELDKRGIVVKPASFEVAAEEAPGAYKNVADVVNVCQGAGISEKVVRLVPVGCVKG